MSSTTPIDIVPGLTLTGDLYETAADGIARFAPELGPLTHERFTTPTCWWLIPDQSGECYKAELELRVDRKLNVWFLPDQRSDADRPHSHPWPFRAHVLAGGYTEDRYEPTSLTAVREQLGVQHQAGDTNNLAKTTYHKVTDIHAPGRTLSLMLIDGVGTRGDWGYWNLLAGVHERVTPDPDFSRKLRALNPHQH